MIFVGWLFVWGGGRLYGMWIRKHKIALGAHLCCLKATSWALKQRPLFQKWNDNTKASGFPNCWWSASFQINNCFKRLLNLNWLSFFLLLYILIITNLVYVKLEAHFSYLFLSKGFANSVQKVEKRCCGMLGRQRSLHRLKRWSVILSIGYVL